MNSTIGKLGIAAVIAKGIEVLGSAFTSSREGALESQLVFTEFSERIKIIGLRLGSAAIQIKNLFDAAEGGLIATANAFGKSVSLLFGAFEGVETQSKKAVATQKEFLKLQLATTISISEQEKELAGLAEQRQILQDISDDDTIGFISRAKAVKDASEKAIEFGKQEVKLALTKEKLAFQAIKQDFIRKDINVDNIETSQQLIDFLKLSDNAKKVSDANDEAFSTAYTERINAQVESQSFKRDQEEKFRKTARDAFEQELDILEEFTEKKIVSNALIIADDKATQEERVFAQSENEKLEKELFENSIDLIVKQGKASIDLRKDLNASEKEKQKALLDGIDLQKIINTQDAGELFTLLRKLDLGEIEEKRTKDSIKIKKDLKKVNEESAKVEEEALIKTKQLQDDILLQEKALADETVDLEDEQKQAEKKRLEERIELLKEDSVARLELEKELNDLLLDENKEASEKDEELIEAQQEAKKELIEKAEEVLENQIRKQSEKRIAAIDGELEQNQKRIEQINQAIQDGNDEAKESLAIEEKRAVELEAKKEKERKKALKLEAGIAILKAFGENDGDLGKTIGDTTALIAFINSLPSFFDGTEDTGGASSPLDSNGGRLTMLHDNERVMTAEQNKKLGGISNDDLADLGAMHGKGLNDGGVTINKANDDRLISEIRDMKNVIKSMPTPSYNWNATDRMHEMTLTSHNKKETLKQRSKNIFR